MRRNWIKMLKESRNFWQTLANLSLPKKVFAKVCQNLPKFAKKLFFLADGINILLLSVLS